MSSDTWQPRFEGYAEMGTWEPWFYLGAILFSVSTWRATRTGA